MMLANPDIEMAFLGSLLLDAPRVLYLARTAGVSSSWFTEPANRVVFEAIEHVGARPDRVDAMLVWDRIKAAGQTDLVPESKYLCDCQDLCPTAAFADEYLAKLRGYYLRRGILSEARIATDEAKNSEDDPDQILAGLQQRLLALPPDQPGHRKPGEVYTDVLESWRAAHAGGSRGIASRWPEYQKRLGGYVPGKIYIVAARPGDGKSTFLGNELLSIALSGVPVSLASLEMTEAEFRGRMLCEAADRSSFRMDVGGASEFDMQVLEEMARQHAALPIRIDDVGKTAEALVAWATSEVVGHGARLIAVDYLQIIMSGKRYESRNVEVSAWMNVIRDCAKRLGVPWIILSQLSRDASKEARRPQLADLRDSGSIEQNAYGVTFIHRPKAAEDGEVEFILAKNRGGPCGIVNMHFESNRQRFIEPGELAPSGEEKKEWWKHD